MKQRDTHHAYKRRAFFRGSPFTIGLLITPVFGCASTVDRPVPLNETGLSPEPLGETTAALLPAPTIAPPPIDEAIKNLLHDFAFICLNAYIQDFGWQGWTCGDGVVVGTTGASLRMEAVAAVTGTAGGVCLQAHVQTVGWQSIVCGAPREPIAVGTTGRSLRMEGLEVSVPSVSFCATAHVQGIGWQLPWKCAPGGGWTFVGTTGESRRMEALAIQFE